MICTQQYFVVVQYELCPWHAVHYIPQSYYVGKCATQYAVNVNQVGQTVRFRLLYKCISHATVVKLC